MYPPRPFTRALHTGRLAFTSDAAGIAGLDAALICVPTPITPQKEPDTSFIVQAASQVAVHACPGLLVVLRSTSYPGTTEFVVRPILEGHGRRVGREIFLAFAPERFDPGNPRLRIAEIPVLGDVTDQVPVWRRLYSSRWQGRSSRSHRPGRRRWQSCWRTCFAMSTSLS